MIIAGEVSGDLHGAAVVRELKAINPSCEIFGIGGDKMHDAGMELLHHVREMNFLGWAEVVKHLPFLRRVLRECESTLRARRPDVVLLIDYPGFNLKLARIAHRMGIPVVYYISPQVWAWKAGRLKTMHDSIDKMLVIFPFEVPIYEKANIPVAFVGHPLLDEELSPGVTPSPAWGPSGRCPLVGMFPGSRLQEISRMLPTFIETARLLKKKMDVQFAVAVAPTMDAHRIETLLAGTGITVLSGHTRELQQHCDVALTKSGTSTVEIAISATPMVVMYKTSPLSYRIGKTFALITHIAMPNIIAGKTIVPEFIQGDATPERLADAVFALLTDAKRREKMKDDLRLVKESLGGAGAARRVAEEVAGRF